ncbi:MAG TPA: hypothetical protein VF713_08305 [Thermoanaerobaculia bacterium]
MSLTPRMRPVPQAIIAGLLIYAFLTVPVVALTNAPSSSHSSVSSDPTSKNARSPRAEAASPHPDAPVVPLLRLISALVTGLVVSAARLARQFRRFLGLGVFTNLYSVLFLFFSASVSGIPITAENSLNSIPHLGSLSPWITSLTSIAAVLILPVLGFRSQTASIADSQVKDLQRRSSSNPILAVIEDAICDRILKRIHEEFVAASKIYSWSTIKLAAGRALEEEMLVRPLGNHEYDAVRRSIDLLRADPDEPIDASNKYRTLLGLLHWCSVQRLRSGLEVAAREEMQP